MTKPKTTVLFLGKRFNIKPERSSIHCDKHTIKLSSSSWECELTRNGAFYDMRAHGTVGVPNNTMISWTAVVQADALTPEKAAALCELRLYKFLKASSESQLKILGAMWKRSANRLLKR